MKVGRSAIAVVLLLPSVCAIGNWFRSSRSEDATVDTTQPGRRSRLLSDYTGTSFNALTCNANMATSCEAWSTMPESYTEIVSNIITIPCGACVDMDWTDLSTTFTLGGLNVIGHLNIPDTARVAIETPFVYVQGKLAIDQVAGDVTGTPNVRITMIGDTDNLLVPHDENSASCPSEGCNVGPKAIVVAGGQLDVNALSDSCPTWTFVNDESQAGQPNPVSGVPTPDTAASEHCGTKLIDATFDDPSLGNGGLDHWYGNLGAEEMLVLGEGDSGSHHLKIHRRTDNWQGPYRELSKSSNRPCLKAGATYFFHANVKLTASPYFPDHVSDCQNSGINCPQLRIQYMQPNDYVVWMEVVSLPPNARPDDDTWFQLAGSFVFQEAWARTENVFITISIDGPEKELDISVDSVVLELAPAAAFPDPSNVCGSLVKNGQADEFDGIAFPVESYLNGSPVFVVEKDGNPSFFMTERVKIFDSITLPLIPGCLEESSTYLIEMKVYVDSVATVYPKLFLKYYNQNNEAIMEPSFHQCTPTSMTEGWSTCSSEYTFSDHHHNAKSVQIFVNLPGSEDAAGVIADAYFDDISVSFVSNAGSGGVHVDIAVTDTCYGPGTQMIFPSNDLAYDRAQTAELVAVIAPGSLDISDSTDVRTPTTSIASPDYAGQLGFLSRKVLLDGIGGTLTVLATPGQVQTLQGVQITDFGIDGVLGRSPIAFKNSGNVAGSKVAKNSITHSKNRCIHIQSTDNIDIVDNVAYETYGHCFALQDGTETGNIFLSNLGAVTRKATLPIMGESDSIHAATFYIGAPENTWQNNVAGGSEVYGYLFETNSQAIVTLFDGNVAHSNIEAGIGANGYAPSSASTLSSTRSFRNAGKGFQLNTASNLILEGGSLSDNRMSVEVRTSTDITVKDINVIGQSSIYKNMAVLVSGTPDLCSGYSTGPSVSGLGVYPDGTTLIVENVYFSGFTDSSGCQPSAGDTAAITIMLSALGGGHSFSSTVNIVSAIFEELSDPDDEIKMCLATSSGIYNVQIFDSAGSLNPDNSGAGTVISEDMICSSTLIDMPGSCAKYCVGTVSEGSGPSSSTNSTEAPPAVPPQETTCLSNGNFEGSDLTPWQALPVNAVQAELVPGIGDEGTAVLLNDRTHQSRGGIYQNIDSLCLEVDSWYEVSADVRLVDTSSGTGTQFICDPEVMWYNRPKSCAFFTLLLDPYSNKRVDVGFVIGPLKTDGDGWNKIFGAFKFNTEMADANDFPVMIAGAPAGVDIYVDNVSLKKVTDLSSSVGAVECSSPVMNGDFETGNFVGWFIRGTGEGGKLQMIEDSGGWVVRHEGRPTSGSARWHGIMQKLPMECFPTSSEWIITARFRIYDESGIAVTCDKSDNQSNTACPTFNFMADGVVSSGPLTNSDPGDAILGAWNYIKNTFTVPANMNSGAYRDMWIFINSVPMGWIYEIDDIVMVPADN